MKTLFVKRNDEYCNRYQIQTKIVENNGKKYAIKSPLVQQAIPHLEQMFKAQEDLKKYYSHLKIVEAVKKGEELWFDFIDGEPLIKHFYRILMKKDSQGLFDLITKYIGIIKGDNSNKCSFYMTPEFQFYFGDIQGVENLPALQLAPLDITCNNLIMKDKDIYFIDYEWCFQFPVPIDFMIFRCISHLYGLSPEFDTLLPLNSLFKELNITMKLSDLEKMWNHFYQKLIKVTDEDKSYFDIMKLYAKKSYDYASMLEIARIQVTRASEYIEAYKKSTEDGFAQKDAYILQLKSEVQYLKQQMLRGFNEKDAYIGKLEADISFVQNQMQYGFETKDIYIKKLENDVNYVQNQLECTVHIYEKEKAELQSELQQIKNELSETKEQLEESQVFSSKLQCEITAIKESTVWKIAKHFYKRQSTN